MTHKIKLLTILMLFSVVFLSACGEEATITAKTASISNVTSFATTKQAVPVTPSQTAPPTSWKAQDLVGQSIEKNGIKVTVKRAEVLASIYDNFNKKELKPSNGVFLVLFFELQNTTSSTYAFNRCLLLDAQKKEFPESEFNATFSLFNTYPDYSANSTVPANSKGQDYRMWDVSADAKTPFEVFLP